MPIPEDGESATQN